VESKVTPGEIAVIAGGAVCLVFSFLPFYSGNLGLSNRNVWSAGLFPVATLIVVFAVAAAVLVLLVRFANVDYPAAGFLGFSLNALLVALTFFAAILAIAFLVVDRGVAYDLGIGYWFVLIGAAASLVGAIIMMNEARAKA
jgi:hypothetical protein